MKPHTLLLMMESQYINSNININSYSNDNTNSNSNNNDNNISAGKNSNSNGFFLDVEDEFPSANILIPKPWRLLVERQKLQSLQRQLLDKSNNQYTDDEHHNMMIQSRRNAIGQQIRSITKAFPELGSDGVISDLDLMAANQESSPVKVFVTVTSDGALGSFWVHFMHCFIASLLHSLIH